MGIGVSGASVPRVDECTLENMMKGNAPESMRTIIVLTIIDQQLWSYRCTHLWNAVRSVTMVDFFGGRLR